FYFVIGFPDPARRDRDRLRCDQWGIRPAHAEPDTGATDLPGRAAFGEIPRRAIGIDDRAALALAVDDRSWAAAPRSGSQHRGNGPDGGVSHRDDRLWRRLVGGSVPVLRRVSRARNSRARCPGCVAAFFAILVGCDTADGNVDRWTSGWR